MQMKNLNLIAVVLIIAAIFVAQANGQTKKSKKMPVKKSIKQRVESDDAKTKYAPDAEMLKEMQKTISVVESKQDWAEFNRQSPTVNPNKSRSAYVAAFKAKSKDVEYMFDVVVVHDAGADIFYEIRGFDFPRPFENLKWTSNDVLQFDQWVNPTSGGRYQVNLKTGKIISAGYLTSN